MLTRKRLIHLIFLLPLLFCSCGKKWEKTTTIAYDPTWFPLNLYGKQTNINGFLQDMLLEIAEHDKHRFQILTANWDNLYETLPSQKADVVFGSLNPHNFHEEKYLFSSLILASGPVLVVKTENKPHGKMNLEGKEVGVQQGSEYMQLALLQKNAIVRTFTNISDGLQMLQRGDLDAIVISQIAALSYTQDLYANAFVIASPPLTQEGLRFIALKKNKQDVEDFLHTIKKMQDSGKMQALLKKWNLNSLE